MIRTILITTLLWACVAVAQTPNSATAPERMVFLPAMASCGDWYWTASSRKSGVATFILAGWLGMIVVG